MEADSRGRESVSKRKGHDRALAELTRAAATFPELRIGQLIMNATGKMDIFYVRDEDLARDLSDPQRRRRAESAPDADPPANIVFRAGALDD